eukprot:754694-Hanusia_phi.AAC.1
MTGGGPMSSSSHLISSSGMDDSQMSVVEVARDVDLSQMQQEIAAIMRRTDLTPQQRQQKIQDIRSGKDATEVEVSPVKAEDHDVAHPAHEDIPRRPVDAFRAVFQPESGGIAAGTRLVLPSELKKGVVRRKAKKDWGECMLTFDKIKEPVSLLEPIVRLRLLTMTAVVQVRAKDGHVYERWAIEKWYQLVASELFIDPDCCRLAENNNRSPLTNVTIDPTLVPLTDEDDGVGARHVSSEVVDKPKPEAHAPEGEDTTSVKRSSRIEEAKRRLAEERAHVMQEQMSKQKEEQNEENRKEEEVDRASFLAPAC